MICGAPMRLLWCYISWSANLSIIWFSILLDTCCLSQVALNQECGKAWDVVGLSRNLVCKIIQDKKDYGYAEKLDTFCWDLIILTGIHLLTCYAYRYMSCAKDIYLPNAGTAIHEGCYECKILKSIDHKHTNSVTWGLNPVPIYRLGEQSVNSRLNNHRNMVASCGAVIGVPVMGLQLVKVTQAMVPYGLYTRLLSNNPSKGILGNSKYLSLQELRLLEPRVAISIIQDKVKLLKNKDDRYGNVIDVISDVRLLILAYLAIKGKQGNMTPALTRETLDGIDLEFFVRTSNQLKNGTFKFTPARRILIPKADGSVTRPLGIASPRQKIVQKAISMVLELIYEPLFLDCSHGFRPDKGCHTALKRLQLRIGNASAYNWVIEGDLKKFFDSIPHSTITRLLGRTIDCPRTVSLILKALEAGYVLSGTKEVVYDDVGTPQGSVLSPILSNVVLHELDKYVMGPLSSEWNVGASRKLSLELRRARYAAKIDRDNPKLLRECRKMDANDPMDPSFKRIFFVRYADDWVLMVSGSLADCKHIKEQIKLKLIELGLQMNDEKTKITHLRDEKAHFLGYDFFIRKNRDGNMKPVVRKVGHIRKLGSHNINIGGFMTRVTPRLILHAPIKKLLEKLMMHGFIMRNKKNQFFPISKRSLTVLSHKAILMAYNAKIRGILNYYKAAHNRMCLWAIQRFLKYSCAITLASKFKIKGRTMAAAFSKFGPGLTFTQIIGGKNKSVSIYKPENLRMLSENERFKPIPKIGRNSILSNFNIDKMLANNWLGAMTLPQFEEPCAICGTFDQLEIHHLRSVKDVRGKFIAPVGRTFQEWKGAFLRKSIPLCKVHHVATHNGNLSLAEFDILSKYKGKMNNDLPLKS